MKKTHFAAAARAPAVYKDWQDRDILSAVLEGDVPQTKTQDNILNPVVSRDVRHIVELHDKGEFQSFEAIGPSHVALMDLIKYMKTVTSGRAGRQLQEGGLLPEVVTQAVKFVKSIPAESIFIRFEVADKKPSLPEYNPAHICAYDADRAYGSDYLQISRRLTITGTTTSVMNDVDLGTLLESGKKKCAVLYMGTHKDEEVTTLGLTSQMALNAVVAGIEGGQSVEIIDEQVRILFEHPEVAELYAEAAELQLVLTEFKNTLSPDQGKEIVGKLDVISEKMELLAGIDSPLLADLMAPVQSLIDTARAEPMVIEMQEILHPAPVEEGQDGLSILAEAAVNGEAIGEVGEIGEISVMEWDAVKETVNRIIADETLSPDVKAREILALTSQTTPLLLQEVEPLQMLKILQDLQTLDISIKVAGIPVPAPLIQTIASTHPLPLIEPQKLLALVEVLATPESRKILESAIGDGPQSTLMIASLDRVIQEVMQNEAGQGDGGKANFSSPTEEAQQAILKKIEAAIMNPSPETAPLVAALANLQLAIASPELSRAMPPAIQAAIADYALPVWAGQSSPEMMCQVIEVVQRLEQSSPDYKLSDVIKALQTGAELRPVSSDSQQFSPSHTQQDVQRDILMVLSALASPDRQSQGEGHTARIAEVVIRTPEIFHALSPAQTSQLASVVLPDIAAKLADNKALPAELRKEIKAALKSDDGQKLVNILTNAAPVIAEAARSSPNGNQKTFLANSAAILTGVSSVTDDPAPPSPPPPPPWSDPTPYAPDLGPVPVYDGGGDGKPFVDSEDNPVFEPEPELEKEKEPEPMPEPVKPRGPCGKAFCECAGGGNGNKGKGNGGPKVEPLGDGRTKFGETVVPDDEIEMNADKVSEQVDSVLGGGGDPYTLQDTPPLTGGDYDLGAFLTDVTSGEQGNKQDNNRTHNLG